MSAARKPSGLRDEEPKRRLEEVQYLIKYLSSEPVFCHEGWVFALKFPSGNLQFIYNREHRSYEVAHMMDLARFMNAKLVTVKGEWKWQATEASEEDSTIEEYEKK